MRKTSASCSPTSSLRKQGGYAIGAQPRMGETLGFLQSARGELAAATPNKGGHRERALALIDQAIAEVRAGIAFAGG